MLFHRAVCRRHAHSSSPDLGREKRLENSLRDFRRHSLARVAHSQKKVTGGELPACVFRIFGKPGGCTRLHRDSAFSFDGFRRVFENRRRSHFNPAGVDHDAAVVFRYVERKLDAVFFEAGAHLFGVFPNELSHGDEPDLLAPASCVGRQTGVQCGHRPDRFQYPIQVFPQPVAVGTLHLDQFYVAADAEKDVVDLMRHSLRKFFERPGAACPFLLVQPPLQFEDSQPKLRVLPFQFFPSISTDGTLLYCRGEAVPALREMTLRPNIWPCPVLRLIKTPVSIAPRGCQERDRL